MRRFWIILSTSLLAFSTLFAPSASIRLAAEINYDGIFGTFSFSSQTDNQITISISLRNLNGKTVYWDVRENAVDWTLLPSICSAQSLGARFPKTTSNDPLRPASNDWNTTVVSGVYKLDGVNSIFGHSLALYLNAAPSDASQPVACASILPENDHVRTLQAIFTGPTVNGFIYLHQLSSNVASPSVVTSDLYFADGRSATNATWHIRKECSAIGDIVKPPQQTTTAAPCSGDSPLQCAVGDLQKKTCRWQHDGVGQCSGVWVASSVHSDRRSYVDGNLPLNGANSPLGQHVVLLDAAGALLGCGRLWGVDPRTARGWFHSQGIKGMVQLSQQSPLEPTTVTVSVTLRVKPSTWKMSIHELPSPLHVRLGQEWCNEKAVGGLYSPFSVSASPNPNPSQNGQPVGDLSAKAGDKWDSIAANGGTYRDWNLPLMGPWSVLGRSLVVMSGSPEWTCGVLVGDSMNVGLSTLRSPVAGDVLFMQMDNGTPRDPWTAVYVDLVLSTSQSAPPPSLKWMIHDAAATGFDYNSATDRCASAGASKFDPAVNWWWSTDDRTVPIGPLRNTRHRLLHVYGLRLIGDEGDTTIGKSIVFYAGSERYACATIQRMVPVAAVGEGWSQGPVAGELSVEQSWMHAASRVRMNVTGLQGIAGGYHIHEIPISLDNDQPCSSLSVKDHFNPFNIIIKNSPPAGTGSFDEYEVGDFSGKYGRMTSKDSFAVDMWDSSLNLYGRLSAIGYAFVIHREDQNTRWVCTNLVPVIPAGSSVKRAIAVFSEGDLRGYIRFTQVVHWSDVVLPWVTTFEMSIYYAANASQTSLQHNWGIHENPVGSDAASPRCASAGKRLNPQQVQCCDGSYAQMCSPEFPRRCELGDISAKQKPYDVGAGRKLFNGGDLPLFGPSSAIGRSVVIHGANGSPDLLGCASIVEETFVDMNMTFMMNESLYSRSQLTSQLASALRTSSFFISPATWWTKDSQSCLTVSVRLMGPNSKTLQSDLRRLVESESQELGAFIPTKECQSVSSGAIKTTVWLLVAVLLLLMTKLINELII